MTGAEPLALLIVARHIRDPPLCVQGFCFDSDRIESARLDGRESWRVDSRRTSYRELTNSMGEEKEKE